MNRRFTDEMLALILVSRTRRIRKQRRQMEELNRRDGDRQYTSGDRPPRYVSNSEFFAPKLTPTLANPNALCFKRVQVVA